MSQQKWKHINRYCIDLFLAGWGPVLSKIAPSAGAHISLVICSFFFLLLLLAARKKSSKWDGGGETAVASSWPSFKKHKRKLAILFPLFFLHSTLCRAVRFLSTDERGKKKSSTRWNDWNELPQTRRRRRKQIGKGKKRNVGVYTRTNWSSGISLGKREERDEWKNDDAFPPRGGRRTDGRTDRRTVWETQGPSRVEREREPCTIWNAHQSERIKSFLRSSASFPLFSLIFFIWRPLPSQQGKLTMKHSDRRRSPSRKTAQKNTEDMKDLKHTSCNTAGGDRNKGNVSYSIWQVENTAHTIICSTRGTETNEVDLHTLL